MKDYRKELPEYTEIFSSTIEDQLAFIKSIFAANNIEFVVRGDSHAAIPQGAIPARIFVKKQDVEKAQVLLMSLK